METKGIPAAALPILDMQLPASLKRNANDAAAVKKVAQEFEALFVGMMLKSMRATVGQDESTGGGRAEETFRSLLDQQYAEAAARSGEIGLARMIEKELSRGNVPQAPRDGNADASGKEGGL